MHRHFYTQLALLAGRVAGGKIPPGELIGRMTEALQGAPNFKPDKFRYHAEVEAGIIVRGEQR